MTTESMIPLATASAERSPRRPLWPRIRRAIFWVHLTAGCVAGLVILLLAGTGVLLTYERQIMGAAEAGAWSAPPADAERMALDALVESVTRDDFRPTQILLRSEDAAPVQIAAGRRDRREFDPWSGAEREPAASGLDEFFAVVTRLHRWFTFEGEARDVARQITGTANLLFIGLLVTGIVIWLPPLWRRALLVSQLRFSRRYPSAKARDYDWHHVIGFWCLLPLLVIAATGTVFHYDWARDTLRWLSGAEAVDAGTGSPGRGAGAGVGRGISGDAGEAPAALAPADALTLEALFAAARAEAGAWNRLTLSLPSDSAPTVEFTVDRGNGAQIQHQDVMTIDRGTGAVLSMEPRNGDDPYAYARSVNRFLHTGEIFGFAGQTVAGLASLGCALLAWTGLALAWRRLILAPLRRRRAAAARSQVANTGAAVS